MSETTGIAKDLIIKALEAEDNDALLAFTSALFEDAIASEMMTTKDVSRIQSMIHKAIKLQLDLSVILLHIQMRDPRQLQIFSTKRITPNMFGKLGNSEEV